MIAAGLSSQGAPPAGNRLLLVWSRIIFAALLTGPIFAAENVPIEIARPGRTNRVNFHREVLPLLRENCLPCHNQTRAKGELNLEMPGAMLKGGDSGPALVPGKPNESRLLQAAAHQLEDLVMPPSGNKVNARDLTPQELRMLALWIEQGAEAETMEIGNVDWRAFPTNVVSSFAVALTSDGEMAAVGRGNRVSMFNAKSGRPAGQLVDPALGGVAQRDWVSALAFSPDGELLAAAGFREVRLWQRQPVQLKPAWPEAQSAKLDLVTASFSKDRALVACVTAAGELEVRKVSDGSIIHSWALNLAPPVRLAWSSDANLLAVAGADGMLRVLSMANEAKPIVQAFNSEVAALTWFDQDRQLATALSGRSTIQTWRQPDLAEREAITNLVATGERSGHSAPITALASDFDAEGKDGTHGSFVSGDADGMLRRWFSDAGTAPQEMRVEGSIIGLDFIGPGARFTARVAGGGAKLVSFEKTPMVRGTFGGDARLAKTAATLEDELALSRAESVRAGTLITEAEAAGKAGDETLKKAQEKREGHAKALADKEKELKQQSEAEVAATKERDQLAAELQRIVDAAQAADKALEEIRGNAKSAAEEDSAAQVAASTTERLKTELERLAASLPESDTSEAAAKTREAATTAARDTAARLAQRNEARAKAEKARDELANRAFAAGERNAEKSRAQTELPPRKKQAEERLAAAQKAVKDLQPQVDKARITLDGSTQDVALAEKSVARANESLRESKMASETARNRIAMMETQWAETRSAQGAAAAVTLRDCSGSGDGSAVLTFGADGLATRWDLISSNATAVFKFPEGAPLAVTALTEGGFFAMFSNSMLHVNTAREWTLHRTIGGADTSSGPFIDRVNALAFSPDGRLLATGGGEPSRAGELKLWRVSEGTLERDLGGIHSDCVMAVAFSPRGDWLATGGADRFARITPLNGEGPRINLEGHTQHVLDVAWQADGSTLATAGAEGMVKLWNPKTGERRKNVEGFGKEVTGVKSVGATNQFVALAGSGQGRVFRSDGEKIRDLAAASSFLQAVSVTRNGGLVAGAGDDGIVHFWDLQTGKEISHLPAN